MNMMNHFLKGLCSEDKTPETIEIIENGTKTVLMKHVTEDGVEYRGTPSYIDKNGVVRHGQHPLIITPAGNVEGTYALNSIAVGGWNGKVHKDPGMEARAQIIQTIKHALISACVLVEQGLNQESVNLTQAIEKETGFKVIKEPMTDEVKLVLRTLRMKNHLVEILVKREWSLDVSAETLVRKQSNFCKLVKAPWTAEASRMATTAALSFDTVEVLKELGYSLKRNSRGAGRRRAANR